MGKVIIIIGILFLVLVVGFVLFEGKEKIKEGQFSLEEKQMIEEWTEENNLNQYGDPKETIYAGGTPLFNEMTGERIDKYEYEYILKNHLDRPWRKVDRVIKIKILNRN